MPIILRFIASNDLPELRTWFVDSELSRRLAFPTNEWFTYVTAEAAARCWVAFDAGRIVALTQVDHEESGLGYLSFAVHPSLRGKGTGTAVLAAFLSGPGRAYAILEGRVEPDNAASLACCRRCGFEILMTPDSDGLLPAIYNSKS